VTSDTGTMTDTDPSLREDAAHASDAAAALLASLGALARSVRAAHAAGHPVTVIGRELRRGRAQARYRRAQNRIRPSVRLAEHSAEVMAAAAACGLSGVRVFGSCVRGEANLASDVDLLVDISELTSLIDITRFAILVEELLGLDAGRVDVVTGDALRPDAGRAGECIAAEVQPLAAWAAAWPRLESLPGWQPACAAGATEEELIEATESGLHPWGETATALRYRPEGRPAGATLIDTGEVVWVSEVLVRYAAARTGGLGHDAAITRAVTRD